MNEFNWIEFAETIGTIVAGAGSGILGSIFYFKPKLRKEKAEAKQAEVEAADKKRDYVEERLLNLEKMYAEQGAALDSIRNNYLEVTKELSEVKLENVRLRSEVNALKEENTKLKTKLDSYEKGQVHKSK